MIEFIKHALCTAFSIYLILEGIDAISKIPGGKCFIFTKLKYILVMAVSAWTLIRVANAIKDYLIIHSWVLNFNAIHVFYLLAMCFLVWPRTAYRIKNRGTWA